MSEVLEAPVDLTEVLGDQWTSVEWRLDSLYWIVDENGERSASV
jgi:hypothetical protein